MTFSTREIQKRSISPIFWLLFGAGGMLSALFGPALILITGILAPTGTGLPENFLSYDAALAFARNPLGKLVLLALIALFFWHGAERVFLTLKDMKAGSSLVLKLGTYGVAALVSVATILLLLAIGF
ncbi:fumarate reductase subunit FrdD [Rhodoblastus acidophilus]|uniref:Fumarate reductase subunit FrdD n=1 Tax=Rhodoblastus acidophilus TaxID=1074 RepID=A0A6N8DLK8_RHOAC|nr:fumarate reductase subunit FrdD [Rhodoblastus acidophilus]MCW2272733.1 fumarate reductase subunit D [Rhodoblastus acidophilus]MTV29644.1 fumarate reductase subunit FrdD [Rhodoblastus acidophilus]